MNKFGAFHNGLSGGNGSVCATSSAAPPSVPFSSAAISAASSKFPAEPIARGPVLAPSPENSLPAPAANPWYAPPSVRKKFRSGSSPGFPNRAAPDTSIAPRPPPSNESTSVSSRPSIAQRAGSTPQKYPCQATLSPGDHNSANAARASLATACESPPPSQVLGATL